MGKMRITLTLLIFSVVCAGTASAQPFAYVTNGGSNNVSVINVSTNKLIRTIDTVDFARGPFGVAVTPDGKFVYVANAGSFLDQEPRTVSVIRTSDNMVVATVDVGLNPLGVAVTPDGRFVYVTNGGQNIIRPFYTVSVIERSDDPVNDTVVATVAVRAIPAGVAVTPKGDFVYVTNSGSDYVSVISTSGEHKNTVVATVILNGKGRGLVAITPFLIGEGNGSGGGGSCTLASSKASNASLTVYLLIPALILIARLWRRRTTQKHT
jgi:YVTN family beta-propeller protein